MQMKRRVPFIVLILIVGLVALGYYLNMVLIPDVRRNKILIDDKIALLEVKKQEYEDVQELNRVFQEIEAEVNTALAALPSEKEIPDIPFQLATIADAHDLSNFTWAVSTNPVLIPRSNVLSLGINLSFIGSYSEIISYLQSLENSLRLINISYISISGSNSLVEIDSPLNVSLQASAYFTPESL